MIISLDTFSYKSCKVTLDSVQKILEFSYYNVNIGTFSPSLRILTSYTFENDVSNFSRNSGGKNRCSLIQTHFRWN